MSLDGYWARVREFLRNHGGEQQGDHNRTRKGEHWELPVVAHGRAGKLLISFHPENQSRAIYQCFDSGLGRHITMENGFKTNGVSYKGLVFSPFSYRWNLLASRDQDLQRWESALLEVTAKRTMAAAS